MSNKFDKSDLIQRGIPQTIFKAISKFSLIQIEDYNLSDYFCATVTEALKCYTLMFTDLMVQYD